VNAAALPSSVVTVPVPRKSSRRAWLIGLAVAVVVVAIAAVIVVVATRKPEAAFRTTAVVRSDLTQRVTATGTLQPVITAPVGAQVSGIVWKLHADFNTPVTAGMVLVGFDPSLFENAVALATAQLATAVAGFTGAQATAEGARVTRDRTRTLVAQAMLSQADLDAATAIFGQTTGLTRSGAAQIAQARAQLERANLDLAHSVVRSPVDGTVISRNIDVGQAVAATLTAPTLFTIAQDLSHMLVHAAVDEADIGVVQAGQKATFTVDAFRDRVFEAVVKEVRNAPQTAQNVVTYDVVLEVANPELRLRPGMTANVLILIVHKTQIVAVSNEALRFRPPRSTAGAKGALVGTAVYVVGEGAQATRVPVTLGVTDGNLTEVLEGLEPGREVIIDAPSLKAKGSARGG
jgi:HlyD family secretion protein